MCVSIYGTCIQNMQKKNIRKRFRNIGFRGIIMKRVVRKGHIKKVTFEYVSKDMRKEEVNTLCNFWGKNFPCRAGKRAKDLKQGARLLEDQCSWSEMDKRK